MYRQFHLSLLPAFVNGLPTDMYATPADSHPPSAATVSCKSYLPVYSAQIRAPLLTFFDGLPTAMNASQSTPHPSAVSPHNSLPNHPAAIQAPPPMLS